LRSLTLDSKALTAQIWICRCITERFRYRCARIPIYTRSGFEKLCDCSRLLTSRQCKREHAGCRVTRAYCHDGFFGHHTLQSNDCGRLQCPERLHKTKFFPPIRI
ncbi:hypothetical protein CPB85DRAFT_1303357, partial [Mucidula mucida]